MTKTIEDMDAIEYQKRSVDFMVVEQQAASVTDAFVLRIQSNCRAGWTPCVARMFLHHFLPTWRVIPPGAARLRPSVTL